MKISAVPPELTAKSRPLDSVLHARQQAAVVFIRVPADNGRLPSASTRRYSISRLSGSPHESIRISCCHGTPTNVRSLGVALICYCSHSQVFCICSIISRVCGFVNSFLEFFTAFIPARYSLGIPYFNTPEDGNRFAECTLAEKHSIRVAVATTPCTLLQHTRGKINRPYALLHCRSRCFSARCSTSEEW